LLGGPDVGGEALLRFYVLHIYVLPALVVLLLSVHIWRVRKDGFAVADREDAGPGEGDRAPEDQEGVSIDA
jgi:cytochrome b-561